MASPAPLLDVRDDAGVLVVRFTRADMTDAALIKTMGDELYGLVQDLRGPKMALDFGKVERMSSASLGMLIALNKVIARQNGQLRVANIAEHLIDIFRMTKLDKVLTMCDTAEAAVAHRTAYNHDSRRASVGAAFQ